MFTLYYSATVAGRILLRTEIINRTAVVLEWQCNGSLINFYSSKKCLQFLWNTT